MNIKKAIEILDDTEADMEYTAKEISEAHLLGIVALEKQMPKKPSENYNWCDFTEEEKLENHHWFCENCTAPVEEHHNYCPECGQKLDWN